MSFRPWRDRFASLAVFALVLSGCAPTPPPIGADSAPSASPDELIDGAAAFDQLEKTYGARLGIHAVDTGTGAEVAWRADERFAYASTIKAMAAAALLDSAGVEGLSAPVSIDASDIVSYSPVTETRVGGTMTLGEIAAAALTVSDNTAANLLFEALGGPAGLDAALARIGDDTTVVSRIEPDLNEAMPGDDRDTTTPRAFALNLEEYLLGRVLATDEKAQLENWLIGTETGGTLVRADLPTDWVVGDRSGAGRFGTRNDLAIIRPPERAPIIIAVMSSRAEEDAAYDDRLIAQAAAAAGAALDGD